MPIRCKKNAIGKFEKRALESFDNNSNNRCESNDDDTQE